MKELKIGERIRIGDKVFSIDENGDELVLIFEDKYDEKN